MEIQVFVENAAVLIPIIIFITQMMTTFLDGKNRLTRFYPVVPIVLGTVAALALAKPFSWQPIVLGILIYGFGAGQAYKIGKTTILGK